jgi:hypothetical protein
MRGSLRCALVLVLQLLAINAFANENGALDLARVGGGQIDDVVVDEPYAYLATGRTVATWRIEDRDAPGYLGAVDKPASGQITGLVKVGHYLYASWLTAFSTSGLTIYSLEDPANPKWVHDVQNGLDYSRVNGLAAVGRNLFLFDSENGIVTASIRNPEKPVFRQTGVGAGVQYDDVFVDGKWIHAFGKNFSFMAVLTSFDVSVPSHPREAGTFAGGGTEFFRVIYRAPYAIAFGEKISVIDLSDPNQPALRGSTQGPASLTGVVDGDYVYAVGFEGLDVWSIADISNPAHLSHMELDTLATDATASIGGGGLLFTRTDRLAVLDLSQGGAPRLQATAIAKDSIDAYDAERVGDNVLFLQANYGLAIADADTLEVGGRYEFDLPSALQDRSLNDLEVDRNIAWIAAWGYGLLAADVSNPARPVEIGRQPFFGAQTVSVSGKFAYLGKNTNGTELAIMEVSNPSKPDFIALYSLPYTPVQVDARGDYLYIAAYPQAGSLEPAGLRIVDVRDPFGLFETGVYNEDCASAFDVAFDRGASIAYLACDNGLHILDISDPKALPARLGYVAIAPMADTRINVEVRGNRAWYGSGAGMYEIDVANPKEPRIVHVTDLAGYGPVNVRAVGNDRVLALTGSSGVHVFEPGSRLLENGEPARGLEGKRGEDLLFRIDVPEGARDLRVRTNGGKGDITLYVKHGAPPSANDNDGSSARKGTNEDVLVRKPAAGTWYVRIVGETPFERVTLRASYRD